MKPEVVLLHDPRRPQATTGKLVLDVILLEDDLIQHLGQRVAAGIGAVLLRFGDGDRMGIDEVTDAVITADQDELLKGGTLAARLKQPEDAFYGDIHDT